MQMDAHSDSEHTDNHRVVVAQPPRRSRRQERNAARPGRLQRQSGFQRRQPRDDGTRTLAGLGFSAGQVSALLAILQPDRVQAEQPSVALHTPRGSDNQMRGRGRGRSQPTGRGTHRAPDNVVSGIAHMPYPLRDSFPHGGGSGHGHVEPHNRQHGSVQPGPQVQFHQQPRPDFHGPRPDGGNNTLPPAGFHAGGPQVQDLARYPVPAPWHDSRLGATHAHSPMPASVQQHPDNRAPPPWHPQPDGGQPHPWQQQQVQHDDNQRFQHAPQAQHVAHPQYDRPQFIPDVRGVDPHWDPQGPSVGSPRRHF